MTLILSVVCNNGICVCADKRNVENFYNGRPPVITDDFNKIYRLTSMPLIIFNHGVNKFSNKTWREYCVEYEKSNRWIDLKFHDICEDFKKFIEEHIGKQLEQNFTNDDNNLQSAFVFCGRSNRNTVLKICELRWTYSNGGLKLKRKSGPGGIFGNLVCCGDGSRYLSDLLGDSSYWEGLNIIQARQKIEKLFLKAVEEKKRVNGQEFSDTYDIECIQDG